MRAERDCVALLGKGCCVVDLAGCERYAIVISSQGVAAIVGGVADDIVNRPDRVGVGGLETVTVVARRSSVGIRRAAVHKSKFHGAFVLNRRVDLHAVDATARWCSSATKHDSRGAGAQVSAPGPTDPVPAAARRRCKERSRQGGRQVAGRYCRVDRALLRAAGARAVGARLPGHPREAVRPSRRVRVGAAADGVDDGATQVVVERLLRKGVRVSHDGRRFTPLDVLGLSSVGLSTKSCLSDGNAPRSIGAWVSVSRHVYRRFKRLRCPTGGGV